MDNELSAVETLREIRARFAALQAENEELRAELASVNENLRIANEAWRAAQNSHAAIREAAVKDHKDMLRFQELYIAADHMARDLNDELEAARARISELEAYADKLARGLPEGMLPKDVENLRVANVQMAARISELEAARRWVPVGERLPNRGQTVYGWIHPVSYVPGHGKEMTYMPMLNPDYPWRSTWDMATYSALDITHWQPLPAGPEVE